MRAGRACVVASRLTLDNARPWEPLQASKWFQTRGHAA